MAERGEGAAAGGSHSRATPSGTRTAKHRGRWSGGVAATAGGVEGLEAAGGSPLPIRKRKIGITEVLEPKRRTTEETQIPGSFASGSSNATSSPSSSSSNSTVTANSSSSSSNNNTNSRKRRRATSSGSNSELKEKNLNEVWAESPAKRQQRSSNIESQGQAAVSLAANAPTTPTRNQASAWRSSSRSRGRRKTLAVQTCIALSNNGENDSGSSKPLTSIRQSKRLKEKNINESEVEETNANSSFLKESAKDQNVKKENVKKTRTSARCPKTDSAKKAADLMSLTLSHSSLSDKNNSKNRCLKNNCKSNEGTKKGFRVTTIQNKLNPKKTSGNTNTSLGSQADSENADTSGISVNLTLRKAKHTSQIKGFNKRKKITNPNDLNQENSSQIRNGKLSKPNCSSESSLGNQNENTGDLVTKLKGNAKLLKNTQIKGGLRERIGGANIPNQKNITKVTSRNIVAVARTKVTKAASGAIDTGGTGTIGGTGSSKSATDLESKWNTTDNAFLEISSY